MKELALLLQRRAEASLGTIWHARCTDLGRLLVLWRKEANTLRMFIKSQGWVMHQFAQTNARTM